MRNAPTLTLYWPRSSPRNAPPRGASCAFILAPPPESARPTPCWPPRAACTRRGSPCWWACWKPTAAPRPQALLEGLTVLPQKAVGHRGKLLDEFDLDAALAAHPALVLVDELAHSNAPGSRHPKRWQDVEELLDAGIDVFTHRQRAAPGKPQRRRRRHHRRAGQRNGARHRVRQRRRSGAGRSARRLRCWPGSRKARCTRRPRPSGPRAASSARAT